MTEYEVTLYETIVHTVTVEAENDDQAVSLAFDIVGGVEGSPDIEYDTDSNGISTWTVADLTTD